MTDAWGGKYGVVRDRASAGIQPLLIDENAESPRRRKVLPAPTVRRPTLRAEYACNQHRDTARCGRMHSSGVPAIGQTFSSTESVTARAAALRPPVSIASAIGRISSNVSPAFCNSTSAEPRMFCTLFARYIAAISRAPSFAVFGSLPMLPTTTPPRSLFAGSLPTFRHPPPSSPANTE